MDKSRSFLVEWTVRYVKYKDVVAKKIVNIENGRNGFDLYVKYKDREQYFIIAPSIVDFDAIIEKISNDYYFSVVTLNSKENFDCVIKSWGRLIAFKFLNIIFVNPFSQIDKQWVVFPYTHHKICDEASLENGLKSMFQMVNPIDENQLSARITS